MAGEAVRRLMTVADFLDFDGPARRYQLFDGWPVAMAPSTGAHGSLQARLCGRLERAPLGREPCRPISEAGIAEGVGASNFFVADIAVTCAPDRRGSRMTEAPLLIVEILSPTTQDEVRKIKLFIYRRLASVREILLVDGDTPYLELHRRLDGADRWLIECARGLDATLTLESVGLELSLADLYRGLDLSEPQPDRSGEPA